MPSDATVALTALVVPSGTPSEPSTGAHPFLDLGPMDSGPCKPGAESPGLQTADEAADVSLPRSAPLAAAQTPDSRLRFAEVAGDWILAEQFLVVAA